ncbi:MAG: zinc-finger domain-containing protein [Burkholderiaceae bacterium]|nr:MAG: zinc-finger domain-containing protein [Burkholderiaceae bacterium]
MPSPQKPTRVVELTAADLTPRGEVYCPHPKAEMARWNTHPRVYLVLDEHREVLCPYCSTLYRLKAGEKVVPKQ